MSTFTTQRENPTHPEYQYLALIHNILTNGERRPDRYIILYPLHLLTHPPKPKSDKPPTKQNRNRHNLPLRTPTAPLQPKKPHIPPPNDKERLPQGHPSRTPLVHFRLN